MPGTSASQSRSMRVMPNPSPTFSRCTAAVVCTRFGVKPARPSAADSAMEKHPACAAAISSSGFVPPPCSKREAKEYFPSNAPLPSFIRPLPSRRVPFHSASDFLVAISVLSKPSADVEVERNLLPVRGDDVDRVGGLVIALQQVLRLPFCAGIVLADPGVFAFDAFILVTRIDDDRAVARQPPRRGGRRWPAAGRPHIGRRGGRRGGAGGEEQGDGGGGAHGARCYRNTSRIFFSST